ncbi:hypothetical protein FB451DRAFT_1175315 [Mycena latifolia]|nr:hypothetical protein FB451DRAFT_1175315 [Mycena latifolia]
MQEAEERKVKKKSRRKMEDGKAKWFTSDTFIQMCIDDEKKKEEEEAAKEGKKEEREVRAAELAEWKKKNELIRGRNKAKKEQFRIDTAAWEVERAEAKAEKRRPAWTKPKWKDYQPEAMLRGPRRRQRTRRTRVMMQRGL